MINDEQIQHDNKEHLLDQNVDLSWNNRVIQCKNKINVKQKSVHSNKSICTTAISKNLRFIAVSGAERKLDIYFTRLNKIIKSIKFFDVIKEIIFSYDFQYIYLAMTNELIQISLTSGFQQVNFFQITKIMVGSIKFIDELEGSRIIFSYSNKILIYDFINNEIRIILHIEGNLHSFDSSFDGSYIVCSQQGQNLSLFVNEKLEIQQDISQSNPRNISEQGYYRSKIKSLRFFNNQKYIIGICKVDIIIWSVDYETKQFIKIFNVEGNHYCSKQKIWPDQLFIRNAGIFQAFQLYSEDQAKFIGTNRNILFKTQGPSLAYVVQVTCAELKDKHLRILGMK